MDKHSFNIHFSEHENPYIKKAVHNVFCNFEYFLTYNSYPILSKDIYLDDSKETTLFLSKEFRYLLLGKHFKHELWFKNKALLIENDTEDYLGTCFYMINSLQEYAPTEMDFLGRFPQEKSYQEKFACYEKNLVLEYFQELALQIFGEKIPLKKSSYFLSHDIDFVNSGWKDELKNALYNFKIKESFRVLKKRIAGKDSWQNIEEIIKMESEQEIPSTFFWLACSGNTKYPKVKNADYRLSDSYIRKCMQIIEASSLHENGIHKAINSRSFKDEKIEFSDFQITKNRYHYLSFSLTKDYPKLEEAKLAYECSLGFSKKIGFRNSYGLPFKAMNPISFEQYSFVSLPLHLMDSSLYYYMKCDSSEKIIEQIEKFIQNNENSVVIGLCMHNNFFEKKTYKKLLLLLKNYVDYSRK
ncbi:MAG: hypothetical protein KDK36_00720 [Leptospiraceae bacterium]|nr:hypothetical protein [Leptospiraceae bacterium]